MTARLDVLLTGYVEERADGEHVRPTVSLVRSGELTMVVDPGLVASPEEITEALAAAGVATQDVTHVFLTHHHVDHTRNAGQFPSAVVVDGDSIYRGDVWGEHAGNGFVLAEGVSVISTPGHSPECASLVVETDAGTTVLTHAWWFPDRTPEIDPLASDQGALEESRRRILALADVVVPGHGAPFTVAG